MQVNQGMGQYQVVLPDVLIVGLDIFLELGAVLGEIVGRPRPCGKDDIQEVKKQKNEKKTPMTAIGNIGPNRVLFFTFVYSETNR